MFMLIRIITFIAGRSILLCEMLEKEGQKGKRKLGKVLSLSKNTFL